MAWQSTGGQNQTCKLASCSKPGSKRCSRCKSACYCSCQHQNEHWMAHKTACTSVSGGDVGSRVTPRPLPDGYDYGHGFGSFQYDDIGTTFMDLCHAPNAFVLLVEMGATLSLRGLRTPEEALSIWKREIWMRDRGYTEEEENEEEEEEEEGEGVHDFDGMFRRSRDSAQDLWTAIPYAFEAAFGATATNLDQRPERDMGMLLNDWSENKVLGVKAFLLFHFGFFNDPDSLHDFDTWALAYKCSTSKAARLRHLNSSLCSTSKQLQGLPALPLSASSTTRRRCTTSTPERSSAYERCTSKHVFHFGFCDDPASLHDFDT